jgi:hypothetical protein
MDAGRIAMPQLMAKLQRRIVNPNSSQLPHQRRESLRVIFQMRHIVGNLYLMLISEQSLTIHRKGASPIVALQMEPEARHQIDKSFAATYFPF